MTPEELREACKMVGLERIELPGGVMAWAHPQYLHYVYFDQDPALPAYVAELLREKCTATNTMTIRTHDARARWGYRTPEKNIRAAMEVLRNG